MTGQLYKSGHIGKVAIRIPFLKQIIKKYLSQSRDYNKSGGRCIGSRKTNLIFWPWTFFTCQKSNTLHCPENTIRSQKPGGNSIMSWESFSLAEVGKLVKFELCAKIQNRKLKVQT